MLSLSISIFCTIIISSFCSLLEAIILSISVTDIEQLKKKHPKYSQKMYFFKKDIQETSSAILALNTIANTLGAVLVGGIATQVFGEDSLLFFSIGMSLGILFFAEIIPKNIGIIYKSNLIEFSVPSIQFVRLVMLPISRSCKFLVKLIVPNKKAIDRSDKEILLLAEKRNQDGKMTNIEKIILTNIFSLNKNTITEILIPINLVTSLNQLLSFDDLINNYSNIIFSRMPVYDKNMNNIIGIIFRRDILKLYSQNKKDFYIKSIIQKALFLPQSITITIALEELVRTNQKIAIIIDEFGSFKGILTIKDIMKYVLKDKSLRINS